MTTPLEFIIKANDLAAVLAYVPMILNFKYWYQTRIRDYGFVGLYFLFLIITNESTSWTFRNNDETFQLFILFDLIGIFFYLLVATRAKWNETPLVPKIIVYSSLFFAFVSQLLPTDIFYRQFWMGQIFYNPILIFYHAYVLYCFVTTKVELKENSKANISRAIWISYAVINIYQNLIVWLAGPISNVGLSELTLPLLMILLTNNTIGLLILLAMHIFLPEAVLITREQLVRSIQLYKDFELPSNPVLKIGIGTITKYLEEAQRTIQSMGE